VLSQSLIVVVAVVMSVLVVVKRVLERESVFTSSLLSDVEPIAVQYFEQLHPAQGVFARLFEPIHPLIYSRRAVAF
jgi:hypothetical protein